MPTKRALRTRNRATGPLTAAEVQWLTGEPQDGANRYELDELEYPCRPADFGRCDAALDRASRIVPASRIRELREFVASRRREFYARHPLRAIEET